MKNCDTCKWFRPTAAYGWDGKDSLVAWLVRSDLRVSEGGWPGKCSVAPQQTDVWSNYGCASWEVNAEWDVLLTINERVERRCAYDASQILRKKLREERERSRARYRQLRKLRAGT